MGEEKYSEYLNLYNEDCIKGSLKIKDNSVDLIICDPPFGIKETTFKKHYNRKNNNVIKGYIESPDDYYKFSFNWIKECYRILKNNGTLYIISGWTNLRDVLNSLYDNNFEIINHCIWKFNFGVFATKKFISSHYHILRCCKKSFSNKLTFNTFANFGPQEKENGKSLLNEDLEDVFFINKEYIKNEMKNENKLPNELIKKLIKYSSNENDLICDFFMGNFTTAYCSIGLGRKCIGFELNENSFKYHFDKLKEIKFGYMLNDEKKITVKIPKNKGKKITNEEIETVKDILSNIKLSKKEKIEFLSNKLERGKFSIINIIKKLENK